MSAIESNDSRTATNPTASTTATTAMMIMRERCTCERLVNTNPSNSSWLRETWLAHFRVGDVLRTQGQSDAALAAFRASLTVIERLPCGGLSSLNVLSPRSTP